MVVYKLTFLLLVTISFKIVTVRPAIIAVKYAGSLKPFGKNFGGVQITSLNSFLFKDVCKTPLVLVICLKLFH